MSPQTTDLPVLGVDLGGTRVKLTLARDRGGSVEVLGEAVEPTPPGLDSGFAVGLSALINHFLSGRTKPAAVGVVVPGLFDDATQTAVWSANLRYRDLPVGRLLEEALGLPVVAGHDVRAALLAEHAYGAARDRSDVLFLPLGTGIAGALLVGGSVVARGPWSGEIGHVRVASAGEPGPECGCGRHGCLEAVAGAGAIGNRWRAAGRDGDAAMVASLVGRDSLADQLWAEAVAALTQVIAPVVAASGTRLVLIGGGLSRSGETLLAPLRTSLAGALHPGMLPEVAVASLGDRAGAVGAVVMAQRLLVG